MLHEFLASNRAELIKRCRSMVALRPAPTEPFSESEFGVPLFLEQLIETLKAEQEDGSRPNNRIAGSANDDIAGRSEIGATATLHGRELSKRGVTVDQVVREYGDLCQAVTGLAFEAHEPIKVDEFKTLNRCLDNAIADAVTEFSYQHHTMAADQGLRDFDEGLHALGNDLRSYIRTATLSIVAIREGTVGLSGATGAVLDLSLYSLHNLVDRSLAELRMSANMSPQHQLVSLAGLVDEINIHASFEAHARKCLFTVATVDKELAVDVDKDLFLSAAGCLLQNAFRFSQNPNPEVSVNTCAAGDRILIDIADSCGGLDSCVVDRILLAPTSRDADQSVSNSGLSICRHGIEANRGILRVRNVPGSGCIFTIDLPRCSLK